MLDQETECFCTRECHRRHDRGGDEHAQNRRHQELKERETQQVPTDGAAVNARPRQRDTNENTQSPDAIALHLPVDLVLLGDMRCKN